MCFSDLQPIQLGNGSVPSNAQGISKTIRATPKGDLRQLSQTPILGVGWKQAAALREEFSLRPVCLEILTVVLKVVFNFVQSTSINAI